MKKNIILLAKIGYIHGIMDVCKNITRNGWFMEKETKVPFSAYQEINKRIFEIVTDISLEADREDEAVFRYLMIRDLEQMIVGNLGDWLKECHERFLDEKQFVDWVNERLNHYLEI